MTDVMRRPAETEDTSGVAACICDAYLHYIERIGKQPGPMLEDYADVVQRFQGYVAVADSTVVGAIVLKLKDEGFYLDNVAVRPSVRGKGVAPLVARTCGI